MDVPHSVRLSVVGLTLTAFRNYSRLRLELDGRPVVLTGPNGAGKTNLLEAVSYLGAGRGLRGARLVDVDHRSEQVVDHRGGQAVDTESQPWAVAAKLAGVEGCFDVGTGRDGESMASRRIVRIDGKPQGGPAALADKVPVLWLTPAQDRLFQDRPGARRRFLDKLVAVLDPAHATRINEYERVLRERSRLLKGGGADPAWLSALERTMAETGIAIAAARRQATENLTRAAGAGTGIFPEAVVTAAGEAEDWLGECPALEAEDRFIAALVASRGRDAETGGAAHGPHRSDMTVVHRRRGLAAQVMSTGEQKTLLLSIILGACRIQAETRGFAPILLLDEVPAHLDDGHRCALYAEIVGLGAQAWMTGTNAALFTSLADAACYLDVTNGSVSEAPLGRPGQHK